MTGSWLDIILVIPLAWGLARGIYKGFVESVSSLLGLILGIYLAYLFAPTFAHQLNEWFVLTEGQAFALSYFLLFVAVVGCTYLLAKLVSKFLSLITLGWLNRLLGGIFGVLKYALVVSVCINLIEIANTHLQLIKPTVKQESILYEPLESVVPAILPYAKFYIDQ